MRGHMKVPLVTICLLAVTGTVRPAFAPLPVRGLHMAAPKPADLPLCLGFIRDALPKEGVNVLVMEFDYRYQFTSHPEVVDADALSKSDVQAIANALKLTHGRQPTGTDVKAGMEQIHDFTLGGLVPPLQITPADHEGGGWVRIFRVQGEGFVPVTNWFNAYRDAVWKAVKAAEAQG